MKILKVPPYYANNLYEIYEENAKSFDDRKILYDPDTGNSSYLELHQLVNNLSANIATVNIKSGDVVGLFVSNGIYRCAAIIASLKLNIPFILLDPILPKVKIEFILQYANLKAVLVDEAHGYKKHWQEYEIDDIPTYDMKDLLTVPKGNLESNDFRAAKRDDIFCILPTSGSTGNSKLVPLTNGNMINRIEWYWNEFSVGCDEVFCSKSNALFVDFFTETLVAILKGHACLLLQRCDVIDVQLLLKHLDTYHVTRLATVPSQLHSMIKERNTYDTKPYSYLKVVGVGGAMVPSSLVRVFLETFPKAVLWNSYGLTETAGEVLFASFRSEADILPGCDYAPIGKPLLNTNAFLVDANGNEISDTNVVGELCVTGLNIFPGYIKTGGEKEILITNSDGITILKTGDFSYRTMDHGFIVIGRKDDTVKVRGHKVNLIEIDTAIRKLYPDVDTCVISKYNECFSTTQCIAFCSFPDANTGITSAEILIKLKTLLPIYMLPRVIILPELPLQLTSGKVDRQKLGEMVNFNTITRPKLTREQIVALSKIEKIVYILSDIINVPLTLSDMDKSFFEVGGDSLAIVQFLNQLNEYGFDITIPQIMKADSLRSLVDVNSVTVIQPDAEFSLVSFDKLTETELEEVIAGLINSFKNEPLLRYSAQHHKEYHDNLMRILAEFAYRKYPEYSVVMKYHGKIIGASLIRPIDLADEEHFKENIYPKFPSAIFALVHHMQKPAVYKLLVQGLKVLDSVMIYVDPSVDNTTRTYTMIELCKAVVSIAKKFSCDAIGAFTSNRAATMIHVDLLGFNIDSEVTAKNFQVENGERPFADMNEDFKVVMMTKTFK